MYFILSLSLFFSFPPFEKFAKEIEFIPFPFTCIIIVIAKRNFNKAKTLIKMGKFTKYYFVNDVIEFTYTLKN